MRVEEESHDNMLKAFFFSRSGRSPIKKTILRTGVLKFAHAAAERGKGLNPGGMRVWGK